MERVLRLLSAWGADPAGGIRRVMGDSEFYLKLVRDFVVREDIKKLQEYEDAGRWYDAMVLSHSMKGAAVNLGLLPIAKVLQSVVDDLREDPIRFQPLFLHMELFYEQLQKLEELLKAEEV